MLVDWITEKNKWKKFSGIKNMTLNLKKIF